MTALSVPQAQGRHGGTYSALEIERYTISQIPEDQRHGCPRDLFTIWFISNVVPLAIVTGALATVGVSGGPSCLLCWRSPSGTSCGGGR
jgi:hypothetical protein